MDTNDLRKAGIAVFLATTEEVARELSNKLKEAADEIDRLREQVASHQAYRTDEFCILEVLETIKKMDEMANKATPADPVGG